MKRTTLCLTLYRVNDNMGRRVHSTIVNFLNLLFTLLEDRILCIERSNGTRACILWSVQSNQGSMGFSGSHTTIIRAEGPSAYALRTHLDLVE